MTEAGRPVRLLHSRVVDQIAAGEVVERPASIVKELVENSLDAGAHAIDVRLEDGGRKLVRVADDGHGMRREDALLAIERHATSKITAVEDLVAVRSLGFRGEALPSIAAVSRFELVTRAASEDAGTRIRITAGQLVDVAPTGAAPGTVITVRELFATLPARREFLRSPSTESAHCAEVVVRAALVRTDVAFVLRHDDRERVRTEAGESLVHRAVTLLGLDPDRLVPIDVEAGGFRLRGVAARPEVHRSAIGTALYLYVGGRWVRDPLLRRAVHTAYRDRIPDGRHPVVVLDVDVPEGAVDVNVHPTKAEVRFQDPSGVAAFVAERLRAAVREDPPRAGAGRLRPLGDRPPALPFSRTVTDSGPLFEGSAARPSLPPLPPDLDPAPLVLGREAPRAVRPALLAAEPAPPPLGAPPTLVGVVEGRWLLVHDLDRRQIVLVDGGRLVRRFAIHDGAGEARRLLIPVRTPLPPQSLGRLAGHQDALAELGLIVNQFSAGEAVIRAVPAGLEDADPVAVLAVALDHLDDPVSAWIERLPAAAVDDPHAVVRRALQEPPLGPVLGALPLPRA